ncbi:MAG: hypothetical protein J6S10_02360 [Clostridia bacterium]|nr:hypothetical protein [Clostridia bacterium]MBO7250984.1 hypothetical protein [Clostridia bacterium]
MNKKKKVWWIVLLCVIVAITVFEVFLAVSMHLLTKAIAASDEPFAFVAVIYVAGGFIVMFWAALICVVLSLINVKISQSKAMKWTSWGLFAPNSAVVLYILLLPFIVKYIF